MKRHEGVRYVCALDCQGREIEESEFFPLFLQASGCSTDPSQSNQGDKDGEDSDDSDIHDDQEGMEALIANQTEVSCH